VPFLVRAEKRIGLRRPIDDDEGLNTAMRFGNGAICKTRKICGDIHEAVSSRCGS
jgi:hypothetical protein